NVSSTVKLRGTETITGLTQDTTHGGIFLYVGNTNGAADTFTLRDFGNANDYANLTISLSEAADTIQVVSTLRVIGLFRLTDGTFTPGTNTVTFNLATSSQLLNGGGSAFFNIVHSGGSSLVLSGNPLTVNGNLSTAAGSFDTSGQATTVNGTTTVSGGIYVA